MAQKYRKRWLSQEELNKLPREKLLEHRDFVKNFRAKTLRRMATDYTLTTDQKIDLLIDYTVGVPLE